MKVSKLMELLNALSPEDDIYISYSYNKATYSYHFTFDNVRVMEKVLEFNILIPEKVY